MSSVFVPDYFENFHCKCGSCRHPCCDGWGINIDEREYFSLLGLECGKRLRHKLDDAFVVSDNPTPEAYATIQPNYLEQCPMLDDDGLCLLQKEKGENMLPLICRVYPRAIKKYGDRHEICMSCSCEETIDLLFKDKAPLSLHETDIPLPFDGMKVYGNEPEKERIRHGAIALMSNSDLPISQRIGLIGNLVTGEQIYSSGDRLTALNSLISLLSPLCRASKSMHTAAINASAFLAEKDSEDGKGKEFLSDFDRAEEHLYGLIPDIETYVGRIISNHLLYESFPYVVGTDSPDTAFAAFVTAVGLLKILAVAGMAKSEKFSDFVDILAFANRFIEHSNFYQICARLDHTSGMETYAKFAPILCYHAFSHTIYPDKYK